MASLERTGHSSVFTSTLLTTFIGSVILFGFMLIWLSTGASGASAEIADRFSIGPIALFEIQRKPLDSGGYEASLMFLSGVFIYFTVWLVIGLAAASYRVRQIKNSTD